MTFTPFLAVAVLALAACGGASSPAGTAPDPGPGAWFRVDNQSFTDFNMYVWRNEARQRLGRSTGNTTVTFRLPQAMAAGRARFRFIADPVGRRDGALSREIEVAPGDTVIMVIPPS